MQALIIIPFDKQREADTLDYKCKEATGLAQSIELEIINTYSIPMSTPKPSTYIGTGHVARIKEEVDLYRIALVILDCTISPVQQRNLEETWQTKVIDRTGLILEIFGKRARTHEGRLQVELASLTYQRSRLVRSWTHLERQRGGFGFLGGPGERQIEIDRRLIDTRIDYIKRDLAKVKKTRTQHRQARRRVPYAIVALIGYTNAGKSTLFNALTRANVLAQDILFATLDPTLRRIKLPSGKDIILSDTVGFIANLPHDLVHAFHATLEEVLEADLLLHVQDCTDPQFSEHKRDVETVLKTLGVDLQEKPIIEVINKIDSLPSLEQQQLARGYNKVYISALENIGIETLYQSIDTMLAKDKNLYHFTLPATQGKPLAWLYEHGEIATKTIDEDGTITLDVWLSHQHYQRFHHLFSLSDTKLNAG